MRSSFPAPHRSDNSSAVSFPAISQKETRTAAIHKVVPYTSTSVVSSIDGAFSFSQNRLQGEAPLRHLIFARGYDELKHPPDVRCAVLARVVRIEAQIARRFRVPQQTRPRVIAHFHRTRQFQRPLHKLRRAGRRRSRRPYALSARRCPACSDRPPRSPRSSRVR